MSEANINLVDPAAVLSLFGPQDQFLKIIRNHYGVAITHRDGKLKIIGEAEAVRLATHAMEDLHLRVQQVGSLTLAEVEGVLRGVSPTVSGSSSLPPPKSGEARPKNSAKAEVNLAHKQRIIKPRTDGQARYVEAIRLNDLTFCRGPAGCGKTYLAVALAVEALKSQTIRKIVLVRPAVEAGESLGFLPGDLQAKLNPYLRPLLDALNEMLDYDQVKYLMEHDVIEVIPLAYMRGRTLNDAFIILDEAQNTTSAQMKMFLTRMGDGSKIVVSGDVTQVDLPGGVTSGLRDAWHRLAGIRGVSFVSLATQDIVRHRLVQDIVNRYESRNAAESTLNPKDSDPPAGTPAS
ncbi:PhoH family protein [Aureliella helgolandensis]|uniref:PhoH-like protein n=1 Tax=Aureliella helgolandensis TaxID=2527968 RepID=A0A518G8X0_9BACT|nr:PhoH family protein [Aureliella helgolandensis]QDV25037.1 PhoH-like protein [Aureliella helgolandensis]